jgi:hypothetical protein
VNGVYPAKISPHGSLWTDSGYCYATAPAGFGRRTRLQAAAASVNIQPTCRVPPAGLALPAPHLNNTLLNACPKETTVTTAIAARFCCLEWKASRPKHRALFGVSPSATLRQLVRCRSRICRCRSSGTSRGRARPEHAPRSTPGKGAEAGGSPHGRPKVDGR